MKFELNEIVIIKEYADCEYNREGRVNSIMEDGTYWVVNTNMPFMGTISDFFTADELEKRK